MALITLPTNFSFTRVDRFALVRQSNVLRSRFTGQGQRVTYPFAVWEFEGKLVEYDGPEAAAIRSFFAQLDGVENEFQLPVPGYSGPSTGFVQTTQPVVYTAAAARATSLYGRFFQNSQPLFNEGDFVTILDELKIITAAVSTNSTGYATINFKPALRKPAPGSTPIIIHNPYALMHAADDDVAKWGLAPPVRHGLELKAIEAVNI